jgi:hypothetical protein
MIAFFYSLKNMVAHPASGGRVASSNLVVPTLKAVTKMIAFFYSLKNMVAHPASGGRVASSNLAVPTKSKRLLIFQGSFLFLVSLPVIRDVAQPGSVLRSGRRGRWFESSHPDKQEKPWHSRGFVISKYASEGIIKPGWANNYDCTSPEEIIDLL